MKLSNLMMMFLALILFAGGATSVANAQNQNQKVENEKDDDDADDSPQAQAEMAKLAKISKDEASRTALARVSGEIIESELDRETGKLVYEFKIRDKSGKNQEVLVDAQTGEMVSVEEENENDDDDADDDADDIYDTPQMQKELAKEATISLEAARQIALARVPGTVIESELDKEKGIVVYEFEIRDKDNKSFDVLVDAKTGAIVAVEADDDEDDDDDTKDNSQAKTDKGKWYEFWRRIPGLRKKKI